MQLCGLPLSFIAANTDLWPQRGSGPSCPLRVQGGSRGSGPHFPGHRELLCGCRNNLLPRLCRRGAKGGSSHLGLAWASWSERGQQLGTAQGAPGWDWGAARLRGAQRLHRGTWGAGWWVSSAGGCFIQVAPAVGTNPVWDGSSTSPSVLGQAEALALGHCISGGGGLG